MTPSLYDDRSLQKQAAVQQAHAWDIDKEIAWDSGVDLTKYFLPLDANAIAFPGLNETQRRTLSQFLGLVINATIAEMESVIDVLRVPAWESLLKKHPVNPEMWELGERFFEEEAKHSRAFNRFIDVFCASQKIRPESLRRLLPRGDGTVFLRSIRLNAEQGGFAFWWVVAAVEEVSVQIYQMMHKHEAGIDPLYFSVHRMHLEEEARHRSYAFLMLELANEIPSSFKEKVLRKTDLILAQTMTTAWVLAQLHRTFDVKHLKDEHPFFEVLSTCVGALQKVPLWKTIHRLFTQAPYISFVLNLNHQKQTLRYANRFGAWRVPLPEPKIGKLFTLEEPSP
jgi:hypothetical protein